MLRPGAFADVNVIDLDGLALRRSPSSCTTSRPAPAATCSGLDGYAATVVNGAVFVEGGSPTGVHAGRTLRS